MNLFLTTQPGLEKTLAAEARELGFPNPTPKPGGVTTTGDWPDIWRANLWLRGASRVLVRLGEFRAFHLAQLDKRSRKFPWADTLRADLPLKVEVTCRKSKIYHAKAATQRIETAIKETLGAPISPDAAMTLKVRIEDDLCTISLDSTGEPLHKRGHKEAVGKAPMRENMAALFLRECGYDGQEPVLDPMCGSGTFPIEAAEIAMGLAPGRTRHFAFEELASFDRDVWASMKAEIPQPVSETPHFFGSDRDAGAVKSSQSNAERAGVAARTLFILSSISELERPQGPPGLVIVNPPYGARIGNKKLLYGLYGSLGKVLAERFKGWRMGMVTTDAGLARATNLPLLPPGPPVAHGGLKVRLFRTDPL